MVLQTTAQKQSSKQLLPKVSSEHSSRLVFLKILQQKTPMLESPNKVAGLKTGNFIKKKLHNKCFPVNIAKFLRAVFL